MAVNGEEEKEIKKGLTETRNNLQEILADGRKTRAEIRIDNLKSHKEFLQKIGDLSFAFGAAIIPVLIAAHAKFNVNHIVFIFIGVFIYLLNGMLALLRIKFLLERDANDAPHIALNEEVQTYPVINALNKLILDLNNEEYQQEYIKAQAIVTEGDKGIPKKVSRIDFTSDIAVTLFVLASLFVVRSAWPFHLWIFWIFFAVVITLVIIQAVISYVRVRENSIKLTAEHKKLKSIRDGYQDWYNREVLKNGK
jgi:hypothetical protein